MRKRINKTTGMPIRTHHELIGKYQELGLSKAQALAKRKFQQLKVEAHRKFVATA